MPSIMNVAFHRSVGVKSLAMLRFKNEMELSVSNSCVEKIANEDEVDEE